MNGSALLEFDQNLGNEDFSWNEYSLQVAAEVPARFSDADWIELLSVVLSKPRYWQERCAEAIGFLGDRSCIPTLISILGSADMVAASIAASELDDMVVSLPYALEGRLQNILGHLEEQKSPRRDDVKRLIANLS